MRYSNKKIGSSCRADVFGFNHYHLKMVDSILYKVTDWYVWWNTAKYVYMILRYYTIEYFDMHIIRYL